ncbi:hypothetical protein VHA_002509 [Grimontia hollisae CIP 101886]|uniref:Uncharacterized protein n=1 Tax=Grimontia hollisae CIP 101886 TaxID=675812 RepID=D0I9H2_GRIHO|nr:hypothetical protein VHA_002509 [Grimontia hollisae CIP 101886]
MTLTPECHFVSTIVLIAFFYYVPLPRCILTKRIEAIVMN